MAFFVYGLMVVCFGGMIWANGQSKTKGATWGRPVAGVFGVLAVFFALSKIIADLSGCGGGGDASKIIDREQQYTRAQMEILGEHLATKYAGSQILLITDPETEHSGDRIKMMRESLEEGLDGSAQIVATESPRPPAGGAGADEEMMMYEYYLTAEAFDQMLDDHPECNMVISLMGLPYDFPEMSFWGKEEEERQKMVVVNANLYDLRKAIMGDFIQAAVAHRPDIKYDINEVVPDGTQAAFDKRYLLITPDNINSIATKYPKMFKPLDADDQPEEDEGLK